MDIRSGEVDTDRVITFEAELCSLALQKLIDTLRRYGNEPGQAHTFALSEIIRTYTLLARGELKGRFAFPLGTGLGKTQSIVAWLSTVYGMAGAELRFLGTEGYRGGGFISVAVSASKIEALCDLKRDLISSGVHPDLIGLKHSYRYDKACAERYLQDPWYDLPKDHASEPCTPDNDTRPILLCSHNRIKGKGNLEGFYMYQGKRRDLLIWDESLLRSESRGIGLAELGKGASWRSWDIKPDNQWGKKALEYVGKAIDVFRQEMDRQRTGGEPRYAPRVIQLDRLTDEEVFQYRKAFGLSTITEAARTFLDMSQNDLRVIDCNQQGGGYIQYDVVVPPELDSVVILDASLEIRTLCALDKTITPARYSERLVSYGNVKIHQLRHPGGRNTLTKAFTKQKDDGKLIMEIVEVVKAIPEDEGIILFTFKAKYDLPKKQIVDFRAILEAELTKEGIDLKGTVKARDRQGNEVQQPRLVWLTHGNETSVSRYSYCSNVIFCGVLHRAYVELASWIAGQSDDLLLDIDHPLLQRVYLSEIAYCLHQGICRSSCRVVRNGIAAPAKVWIIFKDESIRPLINKAMPEIQWWPWVTKHLEPSGKAESLARAILKYLNTGQALEKVSTTAVKKALSLGDIPAQTFKRSAAMVSTQSKTWKWLNRSFVKVGPEAHHGT